MAVKPKDLGLGRGYRFGWHDKDASVYAPKRGLSEEIVEEISARKGEPDWMRRLRVKAYRHFTRRPMPNWGGDLGGIDFDNIYYYIKPIEEQVKSWEDLPEDIKRTYDKLGIPEAEREFLGGVTAQYECLRGSTRVWTTTGMRRIKELEPGEYVFALNEVTKHLEIALVVGTARSGEKEVFEITARGRVIGASGNHPFLVLRDERNPGRPARYTPTWVPLEELRVGDLVAVPSDLPEFGHPAEMLIPSNVDAQAFPQKTSEDLCWWAGFFLGDGYVKNAEHPTIGLAADARDGTLADELRRVTTRLFDVDLDVGSDGFSLVGRETAPIADYLMLNGLAGTAHTKRVPDWVFRVRPSQRLAFLAGFVDADGYVGNHEKNEDVVITSANEALLEDLRELAELCGITGSRIVPFTGTRPHEPDRIMTRYRLLLSGRFDRIPCRDPKRVERLGQRRYFQRQNSASGTAAIRAHTSEHLGFVRIESIHSVGVEETYDIEVMGHHNFVADGFIVHNSEVVYHSVRKDLEEKGVFFSDMDTGLREHPDIVKRYFGTIIPPNDNKFAALNTAVWSGGSFIYVPPGVSVEIPLQAYFRINKENMGQFERTLIVVDEGAYVHYVEGCSAPVYTTDSLHSAVVEIIAHKDARVRYTTIQNWSNNVYNLVTKRAVVHEGAVMEWVDGNIGSKLTMKYPSIYLVGERARGEVLSVAFAGEGQHQDAGGKVIHAAPNTTSQIISKSVSAYGGRTTYRGLVKVEPGAEDSKVFVRCDALILDPDSRSDTYPYMEIGEDATEIGHEATVSKVGDDQLYYLMSRGIPEVEAMGMIVNGFIEPITKELPMEYAIELTRLIQLQMEGAVG